MRIIPIKTGTIHCNKSVVTLGRDYDQWIEIPATAWLIEAPEGPILVDTGMCNTQRANNYHYQGSTQKEGERIDLALQKLGYQPDHIQKVIFTHLHWDHCSHSDCFKKAKFFVQTEELNFAKNPIEPYFNSYESNQIGLTPPFQNLKFEQLQGDFRLSDAIHILSTPGHSPGHQSVRVCTDKASYIIAGDAVMTYENLERDTKKGTRFKMIGRYMDFEKTWKSFEKITSAADHVLPAHDFRVFDQEYYS